MVKDFTLIDTRNLTGIALRYAVAKALGLDFVVHPPEYGLGHRILIKGQPNYFRPEAEWAEMAFIEPAWREVTGWLINELGPDWYSEIDARQGDLQRWFCRGLVGARLGNEVMIPSYLVVSS